MTKTVKCDRCGGRWDVTKDNTRLISHGDKWTERVCEGCLEKEKKKQGDEDG